MQNKILIKENTNQLNEISKDLKQFMPVLNELKVSFEALEIGAFTNDTFKQIILLGASKQIESYIKDLNNQLDKQGVTGSIQRQNAIKGHENVIERFNKAVNDAKEFRPDIYATARPKLPLKFISHENGLFVISKEDKEMILENYCRIYLDTEDEIYLYEVSQNLANAFNKYLEIFNQTGIQSIDKHYSGSHVLKYDNDKNVMILNPEGIKGLSNYKKRREELGI